MKNVSVSGSPYLLLWRRVIYGIDIKKKEMCGMNKIIEIGDTSN